MLQLRQADHIAAGTASPVTIGALPAANVYLTPSEAAVLWCSSTGGNYAPIKLQLDTAGTLTAYFPGSIGFGATYEGVLVYQLAS